MEKLLESLANKRILILGFGREGQSTYRFLRKHFPNETVSIADRQPLLSFDEKTRQMISADKNSKHYFGENYLDHIGEYDVIIKTPGISKDEKIEIAEKNGIIITSQTQLFFSLFRDRIIGVTGTKGKSTTASLICHILKNAGTDAILLGNIGTPALDYADSDTGNRWYVYELSAHQLSDVRQSPKIAVFLNIYREHMDYYRTFDEYHSAKKRITLFQNNHDVFIFNADQKELQDVAGITVAQSLGFSQLQSVASVCFVDHDAIVSLYHQKPERIISVADIPLLGAMNRNNVMAATLVGQAVSISAEIIASSICSFVPLAHRLEKVGVYRGITFYDDALATIPEAAIAAIESFPDGSIGTLIAGGFDREQDFGALARRIVEHHIKTLVLFPTTGERIRDALVHVGSSSVLPACILVHNMEEAVRVVYEKTEAGKICLLSCASPSFGLFKDYRDRSEQYKREIIRHSRLDRESLRSQ
jgi:UDP-N-acetylmuramoyl-L-alanine---L-glutamate ligase